jgi:hypothetical protein
MEPEIGFINKEIFLIESGINLDYTAWLCSINCTLNTPVGAQFMVHNVNYFTQFLVLIKL